MTTLDPGQGRCEIKFVANVSSYDTIVRWITENTPSFHKEHPARRVNSLYFDSYDLQDYQNNLAGISRRTKLRLRWYGKDQIDTSYRLEAKFRRAGIGWKSIHPVTLDDFWGRAITASQRALSWQVPEQFVPLLNDRPQPVLTTRYDREYFISDRGGIRMTIDHNIRFVDQRLSVKPSRTFVGTETDHQIIEFKFPFDKLDTIRDELDKFPLRPSRSSKYVNGLKLILGNF